MAAVKFVFKIKTKNEREREREPRWWTSNCNGCFLKTQEQKQRQTQNQKQKQKNVNVFQLPCLYYGYLSIWQPSQLAGQIAMNACMPKVCDQIIVMCGIFHTVYVLFVCDQAEIKWMLLFKALFVALAFCASFCSFSISINFFFFFNFLNTLSSHTSSENFAQPQIGQMAGPGA